jgi:N-acyl-D-aspartate/D-glutamate deacylase
MLYGLSDAGAHVGTICDASTSTFLLSHWTRDAQAHERLSPERAIHMLTLRNARYIGLQDRGAIAPGMRADLNLIDPTRLALPLPQLVRDLPGGTQRLLQKSEGYIGTWVAGVAVAEHGEITSARPGGLLRVKP